MKDIEFPKSVLNCGGLVEDIANYTYSQSKRPNAQLAFAGALAFVAHLMGRRFRLLDNTRPNLYILAVAWSGTGKAAPRNTNFRLAKALNMTRTVIEDFRSGEGLQDAILTNGKILSQYDEIDTMFNVIKAGKDQLAQNLMGEMLKEWEKSGEYLQRRRLANSVMGRRDDKTPEYVDHPHFSLFATGVTSEVYKSISAKMAMNGFFARLLFIDGGRRGAFQPSKFTEPGKDIVDRCKQLSGWPGLDEDGKLKDWPELDPKFEDTGFVVGEAHDVADFKARCMEEADAMYNNEEDGPSNAVWNRTMEKAAKIALVLAGSDNPADPMVSLKNWQIAMELVKYSNAIQLEMIKRYSAETDYQDLQNRILRKLAKGRCCNRDMLMCLHVKRDDLKEAVETLRIGDKLIFCNEAGEEVKEWTSSVSYQLA